MHIIKGAVFVKLSVNSRETLKEKMACDINSQHPGISQWYAKTTKCIK